MPGDCAWHFLLYGAGGGRNVSEKGQGEGEGGENDVEKVRNGLYG